jgi:hypothetical protein
MGLKSQTWSDRLASLLNLTALDTAGRALHRLIAYIESRGAREDNALEALYDEGRNSSRTGLRPVCRRRSAAFRRRS